MGASSAGRTTIVTLGVVLDWRLERWPADGTFHNNKNHETVEREGWSLFYKRAASHPFARSSCRPQLNMQAAFLISDKNFTEKQVGLLFLVFGLSQFLCMAPAGYYLDYSNRKIDWVVYASIVISAITVFGTLTAEDGGKNMAFLLLCRVVQGGLTAIIPPGFNGITLGIVGTKGFTYQVSRNRMMNLYNLISS